jgi:hypothetical protein
MQERPSVKTLLAYEKEVNAGSPNRLRQFSRVQHTHWREAEVSRRSLRGYEGHHGEGSNRAAPFLDLKTETKYFRTVLRAKPNVEMPK